MKRWILYVSGIIAILASLLIICTDLPFGIPSQWTWQRVDREQLRIFTSLIPVVLVLEALLHAGTLLKRSRRTQFGLIALIFLGSYCMQEALLEGGRIGRAENEIAVLDRYAGGYLTAAAGITDPVAYFRNYAEKLKRDEDRANHLDVHPPGNVFTAWLMLKFCEKMPLIPDEWRIVPAGSYLEKALFRPGHEKEKMLPLQLAAILIVRLTPILNALAAVLLFLTAQRLCRNSSPDALEPEPDRLYLCGTFAAILSAAPVLFAGHCDALYYFLTTLILFLCFTDRSLYAIPAGILTAYGCSCSLAYGMLIPLAVVIAGKDWRRTVLFCAGGLIFAGVVYLMGVDLVSCAVYAARNNSAFFRESGRSVLPWIPLNVLDLILFAAPLTVLTAFSCDWRKDRVCMGAGVLLVFLCVSPFSRGEMGRLLIFLYPVVLLLALKRILSAENVYDGLMKHALRTQTLLMIVMRIFLRLAIVW